MLLKLQYLSQVLELILQSHFRHYIIMSDIIISDIILMSRQYINVWSAKMGDIDWLSFIPFLTWIFCIIFKMDLYVTKTTSVSLQTINNPRIL